MEKLIVEGGRPLEGSVRIAGSKNAALPILAASLLTREPLRVRGAPRLTDVRTMLSVLRDLGVEADQSADGTVEVAAANGVGNKARWEGVRRMRGSVCVLGPLLARFGRAEVSLPGGCVFGVRPIDLHLKGMAALGAQVRIEHGYVIAEAPPGGLQGTSMYLGSAFGSSVLGTANVMMAATLARGRTTIQGAACEPEIVDLADCLNAMGARVTGQGSPILTIDGVEELGGADHRLSPDRIEAGTYVLAGALAAGRVRVEGCRPDHMAALLDRLREARVPFEVGESWIETQIMPPPAPAVQQLEAPPPKKPPPPSLLPSAAAPPPPPRLPPPPVIPSTPVLFPPAAPPPPRAISGPLMVASPTALKIIVPESPPSPPAKYPLPPPPPLTFRSPSRSKLLAVDITVIKPPAPTTTTHPRWRRWQ